MGGDDGREAAALGRDDEPQSSGAIVVVNHGDYRRQEIWIRSGANIGNWYYLGGEYGLSYRSEIPHHPKWEDVLARGPVTLLVPGQHDTYRAGWRNGRKDLWDRTEPLIYDEPAAAPQQPVRDTAPGPDPFQADLERHLADDEFRQVYTETTQQIQAARAERDTADGGAEPTCGAQIPASTAQNLKANPLTLCARTPNHVEPVHADATFNVLWADLKPEAERG